MYITEQLAECVAHRLSDVLEFSDMAESFVKAIGKYSVELLREISDLYLHEFGIFIEVHPDEEEKQMLEQNIQVSLSAGKIDIDDAIDIRSIKNVKIASQLLKIRKKRKEKDDQRKQQQNIQQQSQANQQAAVASEQAKQQTKMAEIQGESELEKLKSQLRIQEMDAEFEKKAQLMQMQQQFAGQREARVVQLQKDKEEYKEDRKDQRTAKQASQQSKLIQQRKQDLDPIDFDGQDRLGSGIQGITGI